MMRNLIILLGLGGCSRADDTQQDSDAEDSDAIDSDAPGTDTDDVEIDIPTSWSWKGVALQADFSEGPTSILMSEFTRIGGDLRLFYNDTHGGGDQAIDYAETTDGSTWTTVGVSLQGDDGEDEPLYVMGGPRVVTTDAGEYRMYLRASVAYEGVPLYKTYSALSQDGKTFSLEEGVRIDTSPDDPDSPFTLAGHGAFFRNADGTYIGIVSADPVGQSGQPSDLFLGTSQDGLSWDSFELLYSDVHDPDVVEKGGVYYLIGKYLADYPIMAASLDGITWTPEAEVVVQSVLDESGEEVQSRTGDMSLFLTDDGEWRLASNWSVGMPNGPSDAIALFERTP